MWEAFKSYSATELADVLKKSGIVSDKVIRIFKGNFIFTSTS